MIKTAARALVTRLVSDYWNGWLYTLTTSTVSLPQGQGDPSCRRIHDTAEITVSRHPELQRQAWVQEPNTWAFGAWVGDELAAVCWFQARDIYYRRGGLFKLQDDEAELAQITTAEIFRGRGLATKLIRHAAWEMQSVGFHKLYAKIWRDNISSVTAFEHAGWELAMRFFSCRLKVSPRRVLIIPLPRFRGSRAKAGAPDTPGPVLQRTDDTRACSNHE